MILVTGAAGFIGHATASALLDRGDAVVGIDNLNDYYDPALKKARLAQLEGRPGFRFEALDLADGPGIRSLFADGRVTRVIHLAAQAGVRYSMTHPHAYVHSNLTGFLNVLEAVRAHPVEHLVYASSSSVYGADASLPSVEDQRVDRPISLYAVTKRSNEMMAYVYARQFAVPATGLRFFTVYGPWGRPDMAPSRFARAIEDGRPIDVYNHGRMERDFTYIDDIVDGVLRVVDRVPRPAEDGVQHRLFNLGGHRPEPLLRFIEVLAGAVGREPEMRFLPMQPGDVEATSADVDAMREEYGWEPTTPIDVGLPRFVEWCRDYYTELADADAGR